MKIPSSRPLHRETIPRDAVCSFAFREFHLSHYPFRWHYHPELELTLIVRGRGLRFVGDSIEDFCEQDLCLLGSNTPHTWYSEPVKKHAVHALVIQFAPELFDDRFFQLPEWAALQNLFQRARRGLRIVGKTRKTVAAQFLEMARAPQGTWQNLMQLQSMLGTLSESSDCRPLAASQFEASLGREPDRKLNTVCSFVNDNLSELPSQENVAKLVRLSPPAFSRFFKRCVGKTYAEYVNELRVSRACQALLETDDSIIQIAYSSGFNNLSNFNRRFLRLKKMTPRQYRAHRRIAMRNGT